MRTGKPRSKSGAALVLVVVILVALLLMLAIAVDIGRLYVARQYLINSCDASALAGGMELPNQAKATTQASKCAGANSMTTYQISFPTDGLSAGMDKIRVDGQLNVQYAFAGIIGQKSRTVSAYAIVSRTAGVSWAKQVVPWGMPYYDAKGVPYHYDNGVLYTLKMGSGDDHVGGNFQALALGGTGGSVYRDNIASGYDGVLRVGDWISSETGNMVGPTGQGVDSRMQQASVPPWVDDTWNNHDYGNPRILIVPIISPLSNGRADVQIIGFAAFWLDSFKGQEVKGYFLSYTIPDAGGSGPADYGVSTFQLFE